MPESKLLHILFLFQTLSSKEVKERCKNQVEGVFNTNQGCSHADKSPNIMSIEHSLASTMQFVLPDLRLAASMGSFILVGGEITKRLAFPHARVMIHQPASSFYEGQTGELILEAGELLTLRETITKVYVQRTGKPLWVVSEDMERDAFMSAKEAQAYGIVDVVAVE